MSVTIPRATLDQAIDRVQRAYAEGRLGESELEHRLDLILTAKAPAQIRLAIADLPASTSPASVDRAVPQRAGGRSEAGALIHLSALISGPILPGLAFVAAQPGSPARREATKALNFQLLAVPVFIVTTMMAMVGFGLPAKLWAIAWLVLTALDALRCHRGASGENPLTQLTGFRPVSGP
ncbi:MAG: DUF1707 domain-containing protein [Propionibacteriaceae bacterium]|nr:DUF1707 domain-containing protein [Propionibacteriaceae bacterium]